MVQLQSQITLYTYSFSIVHPPMWRKEDDHFLVGYTFPSILHCYAILCLLNELWYDGHLRLYPAEPMTMALGGLSTSINERRFETRRFSYMSIMFLLTDVDAEGMRVTWVV